MTQQTQQVTRSKPAARGTSCHPPRLGDWQVRPDGTALQFVQEADDEGRAVKHFRCVDTLGLLLKGGSISATQYDAGQQFATDFARAFASGIVTARLDGLPCGTRSGELLVERNARVARDVRAALDAVGGSITPAGEALWHIVGLGMSIREWALRSAWTGQSRSPKQARSILLGALTVLARHYGHEHAEVPLPTRRSRATKSLHARPAT